MSTPEALRLADECGTGYPLAEDATKAAAELRRQHAEIESLCTQLAATHGQINSFYLGTPETRLLAALAERDALRSEFERLTAERDSIKETLHDELAENLRLRDLGGALPDEGMTAYIERLIAERDALRALSVTNIMLDVVPGEDGMGKEVFATSVEQVKNKLTELGQAAEDAQLERDALRSEVASLRQRPTGVEASEWRADKLRMEWLEAKADEGCVTMCFELDGGVHVTLDPLGGEQTAARNALSVREGIDMLMQNAAMSGDKP
jgi:hypothetical protein